MVAMVGAGLVSDPAKHASRKGSGSHLVPVPFQGTGPAWATRPVPSIAIDPR